MTETVSAGSRTPRLVEKAAQQRRAAVARAIEDAAIELFAERPMPDVTVDEIAAHAGVAIRTLYRYFPSKEHLFAGMPRRSAEELAAGVRARPADETPYEAMRMAIGGVGFDPDELTIWMRAFVRCDDPDRIAVMGYVASLDAMIEVMAERSELTVDDLWPNMAGSIAASALIVGFKRWHAEGGRLEGHMIAALDVAGHGLARGPRAH